MSSYSHALRTSLKTNMESAFIFIRLSALSKMNIWNLQLFLFFVNFTAIPYGIYSYLHSFENFIENTMESAVIFGEVYRKPILNILFSFLFKLYRKPI